METQYLYPWLRILCCHCKWYAPVQNSFPFVTILIQLRWHSSCSEFVVSVVLSLLCSDSVSLCVAWSKTKKDKNSSIGLFGVLQCKRSYGPYARGPQIIHVKGIKRDMKSSECWYIPYVWARGCFCHRNKFSRPCTLSSQFISPVVSLTTAWIWLLVTVYDDKFSFHSQAILLRYQVDNFILIICNWKVMPAIW